MKGCISDGKNEPAPGVLSHSVVAVLGIPFNNVSFEETVEWVRLRVLSRRPAYIATVNMDFITQAWRDPELQRILMEADLVVADGIPIVWLSRVLGFPLKQRVTGSDLVPMFAELAARENFSLYGLGGAEGVAGKALSKLSERFPGMRTAGCYSPPKADIVDMDNDGMLKRLADADPDILLVALGAPKQEKWVNMHIRRWKIPVSIGIGGSLDFLAGVQKRAPRWVQRLALEWLWRMLSDPRRLLRRYVSNITFFVTAIFRLVWLRWAPVAPVANALENQSSPVEGECDQDMCRIKFPDRSDAGGQGCFREDCEKSSSRALLVDMGSRNWLDAREIGELLILNRLCRSSHRWLCLLVSHPRLLRMLRFVRLDRYVCVAADMHEVSTLLRSWKSQNRDGFVEASDDRLLHIVLPAELTAVNVTEFRAEVETVWQNSADPDEVNGVAVDASSVTFIDSAGLGFLVGVRKKALSMPGGFQCSGFHGNALRTLSIARVEKLFSENSPEIGGEE